MGHTAALCFSPILDHPPLYIYAAITNGQGAARSLLPAHHLQMCNCAQILPRKAITGHNRVCIAHGSTCPFKLRQQAVVKQSRFREHGINYENIWIISVKTNQWKITFTTASSINARYAKKFINLRCVCVCVWYLLRDKPARHVIIEVPGRNAMRWSSNARPFWDKMRNRLATQGWRPHRDCFRSNTAPKFLCAMKNREM